MHLFCAPAGMSVSYGMGWFLGCWGTLAIFFLMLLLLAWVYGIEGRKGTVLILILVAFAIGLVLVLSADYLFFFLAVALHL